MIDPQLSQTTVRPGNWIGRAAALLLVAIGLQVGSFGELASSHKRYVGTEDHGSVALTETRKEHATRVKPDRALEHEPTPGAEDTPEAAPYPVPPASAHAAIVRRALRAVVDTNHPHRLLPDPTGPPSA